MQKSTLSPSEWRTFFDALVICSESVTGLVPSDGSNLIGSWKDFLLVVCPISLSIFQRTSSSSSLRLRWFNPRSAVPNFEVLEDGKESWLCGIIHALIANTASSPIFATPWSVVVSSSFGIFSYAFLCLLCSSCFCVLTDPTSDVYLRWYFAVHFSLVSSDVLVLCDLYSRSFIVNQKSQDLDFWSRRSFLKPGDHCFDLKSGLPMHLSKPDSPMTPWITY